MRNRVLTHGIALGAMFLALTIKAHGTETSIKYLKQNWTESDRQRFYSTTQGSRLIPYVWFVNLEQPDSQALFIDQAHMEGKMGFLFPLEPLSNDRLPIGFVADDEQNVDESLSLKKPGIKSSISSASFEKVRSELAKTIQAQDNLLASPATTAANEGLELPSGTSFPRSKKWLGLTCAACHTSELSYKGNSVRIDGGPALSDFTSFTERLVAALDQTLKDEEKFNRFAKRLGETDATRKNELRTSLKSYTETYSGFVARNKPPIPYGHGRIDAFGMLINEIVGTATDIKENWRVPNAPTSYPALWRTPNLNWVQWNGSSHSPLARNIGEVLGVFADVDLRIGSPTIFRTSANVTNLFHLEEWLKTLNAPRWPVDTFGALDQDRLNRGKTLYVQQQCASCHSTPPGDLTDANIFGRRLIQTKSVPISEVKTDPLAAINFISRTAKPGVFKAALENKEEVPVPNMLAAAVRKIMKVEFERLNLPAAQRLDYLDQREDLRPTVDQLKGYKARTLEGVWATAPYLHNGSVPTLYDMLLPPDQRPKQFHVGTRAYDPVKVGFENASTGSLLDTLLPGNSNQGHEYGVSLSHEEKLDLVEYLKSL